MPQPSLLATLLATVLSFVLGGLWYGPVFGKTWMRLVGVTEATLRENFNPAKTYGITFVLGFSPRMCSGCFSARTRAWHWDSVPAPRQARFSTAAVAALAGIRPAPHVGAS
jgi:hypothetical protein